MSKKTKIIIGCIIAALLLTGLYMYRERERARNLYLSHIVGELVDEKRVIAGNFDTMEIILTQMIDRGRPPDFSCLWWLSNTLTAVERSMWGLTARTYNLVNSPHYPFSQMGIQRDLVHDFNRVRIGDLAAIPIAEVCDETVIEFLTALREVVKEFNQIFYCRRISQEWNDICLRRFERLYPHYRSRRMIRNTVNELGDFHDKFQGHVPRLNDMIREIWREWHGVN